MRAAPVAVTLAVLSLSWTAAAKPEYATAIPNYGVNTCTTCHPAGSTATENAFGLDVKPLVGSSQSGWWLQLWDTDSDGDGQTNGQELGDPCGAWATGDTPGRTTDISNPGDPGSTSADPDSPPCDGTSASATSSAAGSTSSGASTSTTGGAGAGGGGVGGAERARAEASPRPGIGNIPETVQTGSCSTPLRGGSSAPTSPSTPAWLVMALGAATAWARRRKS